MFREEDFVRIAKRENNTKRSFLIVNPLQGKHIPVSPSVAMSVFSEITNLIREQHINEKLLVIGFAETATALGSQIAIDLSCDYIQTTREVVKDSEYLFFSEEHSHATEQKLVKNGLNEKIYSYDRIIFVDDEISTGKTILNIINAIEKSFNRVFKYSVASILNGMDERNFSIYKEKGISLFYLVKTHPEKYAEIANSLELKVLSNMYLTPDFESSCPYDQISVNGFINSRKLLNSKDYLKACDELWNQIQNNKLDDEASNLLIIGTEEFMYPAMYVGKKYEELGKKVKFHATTRSPIMVCEEAVYPLHKRYELKSLYDSDRITYIYDIKSYDKVLIITDSNGKQTVGVRTLINALSTLNSSICLIRWQE